jgi:hypothetical protein
MTDGKPIRRIFSCTKIPMEIIVAASTIFLLKINRHDNNERRISILSKYPFKCELITMYGEVRNKRINNILFILN